MSYVHSSTMLQLETQDDLRRYDDNPEGMAEALRDFDVEVEKMKRFSPHGGAWEYLQLVRIRAGRHGEADEEVRAASEDLFDSKHSKRRGRPCVFWWKSDPSRKFEDEHCCP